MKEAQDREGLMGEALRRAVRGRQRGPGGCWFSPSLSSGRV